MHNITHYYANTSLLTYSVHIFNHPSVYPSIYSSIYLFIRPTIQDQDHSVRFCISTFTHPFYTFSTDPIFLILLLLLKLVSKHAELHWKIGIGMCIQYLFSDVTQIVYGAHWYRSRSRMPLQLRLILVLTFPHKGSKGFLHLLNIRALRYSK